MPEVGEYWYDAHGSWEVVRVVEVTDATCSFLVVNTIVRPPTSGGGEERIGLMDLDDFTSEYQDEPAIEHGWLEMEAGSTWFDRRDASRRVVIEAYDTATETVTFRTPLRRGVGNVTFSSGRAFTEQFVRVQEDAEEGLTDDRFWVLGAGICAVFISRADAQAFLFEVSALLNQADGSLTIHQFGHPATPLDRTRSPAGGGVFIGGGGGGTSGITGLPGVGGIVNIATTFGEGVAGGAAAAPPPPPRPSEPLTLWERLTPPDE